MTCDRHAAELRAQLAAMEARALAAEMERDRLLRLVEGAAHRTVLSNWNRTRGPHFVCPVCCGTGDTAETVAHGWACPCAIGDCAAEIARRKDGRWPDTVTLTRPQLLRAVAAARDDRWTNADEAWRAWIVSELSELLDGTRAPTNRSDYRAVAVARELGIK